LSYYYSRCSHYRDIAVDCEGEVILLNPAWNMIKFLCLVPCMNGSIRLAGGSSPNSGRVEVCMNNTWGLICPDDWDNNDSAVICHQLGFLKAGTIIIG
jgi:hypothetical protein